jgi:enoyl-CoA hydratase
MNYSDFEHLSLEDKGNGILLVTLDRPEMNIVNARMHVELSKIWDVVDQDANVKVVVVTGAGDRAFSAGGELSRMVEQIGNSELILEGMKETSDIVYKMLSCEKPIISAINGVAVGAGLTVALMADISIMAEEARFTDGHAKLGIVAGDHAVINWPLLCGMAKAKYYLMTADFIDGREAERIGLVSRCVPRAILLDEALSLAGRLADGSQPAVRMTKRALNNWLRIVQPAFEASLAMEMISFFGDDIKEGVAAIQEKRQPRFPSAVVRSPIKL